MRITRRQLRRIIKEELNRTRRRSPRRRRRLRENLDSEDVFYDLALQIFTEEYGPIQGKMEYLDVIDKLRLTVIFEEIQRIDSGAAPYKHPVPTWGEEFLERVNARISPQTRKDLEQLRQVTNQRTLAVIDQLVGAGLDKSEVSRRLQGADPAYIGGYAEDAEEEGEPDFY